MAQGKIHSSPLVARNSPRSRRLDDSPSRQLHFELERTFSQIQLQEAERQKVYVYQRRQQQEELDAKELAQAEVHRTELNLANAQHEVVRLQAEAVLHAYLKKDEEERRRREDERRRLEEEERKRREEEESRKRAEQERKAREEKERKEREERAKAEAERLAIYERQKAEAEERRRKEKEATELKQREEKEKVEQEAALKAQEAEKAAAAAAKATIPTPTPPTTTTNTQIPSSNAAATTEGIHRNYLLVHKRLKQFRKDFWEKVKKDPNLKPHVGDMRRAMRASVGQLTDDKVGNKKAHDRVRMTLHKALREIPSPPVPLNGFLPPHLSLNDNGTTTIPSLVLYLLSIFSKAIINSFVGECAVNPKAAEPIGTLVAQIFSMPELQFPRNVQAVNALSTRSQTESLISVLMSKFHASAPILFGIYGPEHTIAGKLRVGWRTDRISDDKKAFVTDDKHYDRQTGLGVGYASIALRNFSRAKISNPWPPTHFWSSLAHVVNTPPSEVQISHLILLKNMLENNAIDRFVLFFGAAGVAALRQAVVDFPRKLSKELQEKPIAKALALMVAAWKTDKHFRLD
ncbi:hypothetical protein LTR20_002987 [Exophiala xenobiotica]|nr:hypothetical protein LTS13_000373 [Exophiala xenobiotica]KAK5403510.1 hypothetical protein LTR79_000263 [Exophiala xenobiotica]KAK5422999.1 hypothetical protein LTR90_002017 [Exophiala xenobiotica]KAK5468641.1 hypothetical protein LTR20_002987 [Exophiala xenobiotica]KAK5495525.1 hypothetical protein LTR26_002141 [Exophiala xenobiotica]